MSDRPLRDIPKEALHADDAQTRPEAPFASEAERILAELQELDRSGKVDEAALARLDERMRKEFERTDREQARLIAEAQAGIERLRRPASRRWVPVALAMAFVMAGVTLELTLGRRFVVSFADAYRAATPWLFAALLVLLFVVHRRFESLRQIYRNRYPTAWVRRFLMLPITAALLALAILVTPLGWAALLGWAFAGAPEPLSGKLLSLEERSPDPYSCALQGKIRLDRASSEICLDGLVTESVPKAGDPIRVVGRQSRFGVLIEGVVGE
jgi:hypothetical protein